MSKAATFYTNNNLQSAASHFSKMLEYYNINASQGVKSEFELPTDITADRRVEGYIRQIQDLEEEVDRGQRNYRLLEEELDASKKTIRGYHDSVVLTPHQVLDYP